MKTQYKCIACDKFHSITTPTETLHEIVFGHGNRQVCIDNSIQVPLCQRCHAIAHGRKDGQVHSEYDCMSQIQCYMFFCDYLEISYDCTQRGVRTIQYRHLLSNIKPICVDKLKELEI